MKTPDINNPEAVAAFLNKALATQDTATLLAALDVLVKAHGVTAFARTAGMARESVYKAVREGNSPSFETVRCMFAGLGLRLAAETVTTK